MRAPRPENGPWSRKKLQRSRRRYRRPRQAFPQGGWKTLRTSIPYKVSCIRYKKWKSRMLSPAPRWLLRLLRFATAVLVELGLYVFAIPDDNANRSSISAELDAAETLDLALLNRNHADVRFNDCEDHPILQCMSTGQFSLPDFTLGLHHIEIVLVRHENCNILVFTACQQQCSRAERDIRFHLCSPLQRACAHPKTL